jgi:hypothetical protein
MKLSSCWPGAPVLVVLAIGCSSEPPPAASPTTAKVAGSAPAKGEKNVKKVKVIGQTVGPIGVVD